ncbi:DUF4185 domain-containing protein [Gordonia shandongensis]|uniref:DUF4185 domain-containing protein n=1 Tax=Gordonia shandongensis TaxID=376351 RepID=UPI0003FC0636|nr:DUF4185 domain-containing protein [Gordonia shandongensis]
MHRHTSRRPHGRARTLVTAAVAALAAVPLAAVTVTAAGGGVADARACSTSGTGSVGTTLPFIGSILPRGGDPRGPQGPLPGFDNGTTRTVAWVTGPKSPNRTFGRFGISGTDVGVAWDNGRGQTLLAFGDTFGNCLHPNRQWRHNALLRSTDPNLADGLRLSGRGFAGEMFGAVGFQGVEMTTIPTAGISVDGTQYVNYMSVRAWGAPSRWDTNYSATAVSRDNGRTWFTPQRTIRVNVPATAELPAGWPSVQAGNEKFQQAAYVRGRDGYVYQYGTPNGRFGAAYLARFRPGDITNLEGYRYWTGRSWASSPAAARPVVRGPVTELSVAWSPRLNKYVMLDSPRGVLLRTADRPQGPWSRARRITPPRLELYAPMMLPSSPALRGTGPELYFNASRWDDYNVLLVRTRI